MFLIDRGKADACAIGWVHKWVGECEPDELVAVEMDTHKIFGNPFDTDSLYPYAFRERVLAWIYYDEWVLWRTIQRVLA